MLGIIAYRSEEHESYSVEYLILSSPATQLRNNIDIIIAKLNGDIAFGGSLNIENNNNMRFSLRSISHRGGFPLIIKANLIDERPRLERAEFSTSIGIRNQPKKAS